MVIPCTAVVETRRVTLSPRKLVGITRNFFTCRSTVRIMVVSLNEASSAVGKRPCATQVIRQEVCSICAITSREPLIDTQSRKYRFLDSTTQLLDNIGSVVEIDNGLSGFAFSNAST